MPYLYHFKVSLSSSCYLFGIIDNFFISFLYIFTMKIKILKFIAKICVFFSAFKKQGTRCDPWQPPPDLQGA